MSEKKHMTDYMRRKVDQLHQRFDTLTNYEYGIYSVVEALGKSVPLTPEEDLEVDHMIPDRDWLEIPQHKIKGLIHFMKTINLEPVPIIPFVRERTGTEAAWSLLGDIFMPHGFLCGQPFDDLGSQISGHTGWYSSKENFQWLGGILNIIGTGPVISATLTPPQKKSHQTWHGDPMAAPAEALAVVSNGAKSYFRSKKCRSVLCVGMGHCAATQVLSALLPSTPIYHIPSPYQRRNGDQELQDRRKSEMMILGCPDHHQWRAMKVAKTQCKWDFTMRHGKGTFLEYRRWIASNSNRFSHINELLEVAIRFKRPGQFLSIVADLSTHPVVVKKLEKMGLIESAFDYCPYQEYTIQYEDGVYRGPSYLPPKTGRVVSFWIWK